MDVVCRSAGGEIGINIVPVAELKSEQIVACPARNTVIVIAAHQRVGAVAAVHRIKTVAGEDRVAVQAAVD